MLLGVQYTVQELTDAIRSLANGNAVGPDGVSVVLLKLTLNSDPTISSFIFGGGGEMPQQWKYDMFMVLH